ncbi:MAG: protease pro-enzyme activation domain-containing protein [Candidatus Thermoplasmatota archaeon]|nr:protease pro-enzyme activation domain-containing protein [Candidatus Thermoplasmatota archaeon]
MSKLSTSGMLRMVVAIFLILIIFISAFQINNAYVTHPGKENFISAPAGYVPVAFNGQIIPVSSDYKGKMHIDIIFNFSNQNGLMSFLSNLSDPSSSQYHKYLTGNQFDSRYAPSRSVYDSAVSYFQQNGMYNIHTYSNRLTLSMYGSAHNISLAFHTNITTGTQNGQTIYSPSAVPELPEWLSGSVNQVIGLSNGSPMYMNLRTGGMLNSSAIKQDISPPLSNYPAPQTHNGIQYIYGSDLQVAYNETGLFSKTYATGQVIATLLWSGFNNNTKKPTGPYDPATVGYYLNKTIPSGEPMPKIYGYSVDNALPPGPSAKNDTSGAVFENTLDLEMAGSMAPGASIYNVYGPNASLTDLSDAMNAILSAKSSSPLYNVTVISNSWGSGDLLSGTWNQYFKEAQARGITILASSGDTGDNNKSSKYVGGPDYVQFPSAAAYNNYGVTAVGGTNLTLSASLAISSEQVWYTPGSDPTGSTGGISSVYHEPSWQNNSQANITLKGQGRGVPDIAAIGNNTLVQYNNTTANGLFIASGTSISSPVVAGIIAAMDANLSASGEPALGFINPAIYRFGSQQYDPSKYGNPVKKAFFDITHGRNYVYSALAGYDLVTGMGSMDAVNFLTDLNGGVRYNVTFNETGLASATPWNVTIAGHNYPSSTQYINLSLPNGTYQFQVPVAGNMVANPVAGSFNISGKPLVVNLSFSRGYEVNFTEHNLINGTQWVLNAWNYSVASSSQGMTLVFPNGTFVYHATSLDPNYRGYSGNFTVNGTGINVSFNFTLGIFNVTFIETGLPTGQEWKIQLPNETRTSTGNTTIFTLPGGYYVFKILPAGKYISNNTVVALNTNGENQTVYLNFSYGYFITFIESGLPSGSVWEVNINNYNLKTTNTTIKIEVQNGTYHYVASGTLGNKTFSGSGNVTVNGSNQTVNLIFQKSRSQTGTEILYAALAAFGIAIFVVGLMLYRRK